MSGSPAPKALPRLTPEDIAHMTPAELDQRQTDIEALVASELAARESRVASPPSARPPGPLVRRASNRDALEELAANAVTYANVCLLLEDQASVDMWLDRAADLLTEARKA